MINHPCHLCNNYGLFGFCVNLAKNQMGLWFCAECKDKPEAAAAVAELKEKLWNQP